MPEIFVAALLVVEQVAADFDLAGAVVDLQQVVVEAVMQNVVFENDASGFSTAVLHLHEDQAAIRNFIQGRG